MTFTVNGVDITPYIANKGLKYTRNDIDGPNAGRMQSGEMFRDRKAVKVRWDVTCIPLTSTQLQTILTAIYPEFISVTYTDPMTGLNVSKTMYSNNVPSQYLMLKTDGTEYWSGLVFPLVEK